MGNERRGEVKWLLAVVAVASAISIPVLSYGFPLAGHDAFIHFNWHKFFLQQLQSGEVYPRWLPEMNYGFGSPAFFYYPPLVYYITALIGSTAGGSGSDDQVWGQLGVSAALAIIASGVTCYLWLKKVVASRTDPLGRGGLGLVLPVGGVANLYDVQKILRRG